MDRTEAINVLEDALFDVHRFAEISTAPTDEQLDALNSVYRDDIAPRDVCAEMDLERGSTWGDVVAAIREDISFPEEKQRIEP
jgi:hypothetical protein